MKLPQTSLNNPIAQIHIAVFLWGFTGILGKLISIDALSMVFLRMTITGFVFLLLPRTRKGLKNLGGKNLLRLMVIGSIICLHWICFYHSIKVYNSSSIAMICLGTGAMFVIWVEYFLRIKKNISRRNIMISLIAIVGMYFISNGSKLERFSLTDFGAFEWAIVYGVLASLLAAIFTILNGKMTSRVEPAVISFVEISSGALLLLIYHTMTGHIDFVWQITKLDWIYLLVLSVLCTNIPFLLSIFSLKKLEPFIVTLTVNLEPIYGLIFAAIIFSEHEGFNMNFYIGASLILISVFLPIMTDTWQKRKS